MPGVSVQMPLEADKNIADILCRPELGYRIADGVVLELDQMRQFLGIQFAVAALDVVLEHEAQKLALGVIQRLTPRLAGH